MGALPELEKPSIFRIGSQIEAPSILSEKIGFHDPTVDFGLDGRNPGMSRNFIGEPLRTRSIDSDHEYRRGRPPLAGHIISASASGDGV